MNNQLKKGVLDLVILSLIKNKDMHGYLVVQKLEPYIKVKESSIYIILTRLTQNNYLESYTELNNNRKVKVYKITQEGENYLEDLDKNWDEITELVNSVRSNHE